VKFVGRDRQQIDPERLDVYRDLAGRLHRIRMHQRASRLRHARKLRNGLNRADFIVGVHDRHERRFAGQGGDQVVG
jgi:hypothetical protein